MIFDLTDPEYKKFETIQLDFDPCEASGAWFSDSERVAIASPKRFEIFNIITGLRLSSKQTETVNSSPKILANDSIVSF